MWTIKVTSFVLAALLLYPVARTFYQMCVFERPVESDESPADFPPPESVDSEAPSFAVMVSQTIYTVVPFDPLYRLIGYGPRRWVGLVGLSATIVVFLLLSYSAFFPVMGPSHSYEWKDEPESFQSIDALNEGRISSEGLMLIDPQPEERSDDAREIP